MKNTLVAYSGSGGNFPFHEEVRKGLRNAGIVPSAVAGISGGGLAAMAQAYSLEDEEVEYILYKRIAGSSLVGIGRRPLVGLRQKLKDVFAYYFPHLNPAMPVSIGACELGGMKYLEMSPEDFPNAAEFQKYLLGSVSVLAPTLLGELVATPMEVRGNNGLLSGVSDGGYCYHLPMKAIQNWQGDVIVVSTDDRKPNDYEDTSQTKAFSRSLEVKRAFGLQKDRQQLESGKAPGTSIHYIYPSSDLPSPLSFSRESFLKCEHEGRQAVQYFISQTLT